MTAAKAFTRDRDAALRSLDAARFEAFLRKWQLPRPRHWIGDAWLASMHKGRLHLDSFDEAEKEVSRVWLAANGYTENVGSGRPCPACSGIGTSQSDCPVCGTAT